ncbi:MAG: hypothetical protein LBJ11_01995 [Oscillospiraceae bacterium]|jgi:flavodoxin|nr:hypothetical protein [Oscillospiraceae bacterium]
MKSLVLYYSLTGHTKALAQSLAAREDAERAEIADWKKPGALKSFLAGCPAAMGHKAWPIRPLPVNLADYDRIFLLAPIWAGNVPPAVDAVLERFPEGKTVEVTLVSGSGKSKCAGWLRKTLEDQGCSVAEITDVKAE